MQTLRLWILLSGTKPVAMISSNLETGKLTGISTSAAASSLILAKVLDKI
jgi:hypothetical protein